jgi:hypothetical protein
MNFDQSSLQQSVFADTLPSASGGMHRMNFGRFSSQQSVFPDSSLSVSSGQSSPQQSVFAELSPSISGLTSIGRSSESPAELAKVSQSTSSSVKRMNFGRFSSQQSVLAESPPSFSCGTVASSDESCSQQSMLAESSPSIVDDTHITNFDRIPQPESEPTQSLPPTSGEILKQESAFAESSPTLQGADATRVGYLRSVTARVAQQAHISNNGGFISAIYQMSEAASLRLTPQPVRDALIESARSALNLPRLEFGPGARDSIESAGVWSIHVQSPLARSSDAEREFYFQNMLHALDSVHSDKNAILACLHRFRMWESSRVSRSESRKICRNVLLGMIIRRNMLNSAWSCMEVESPHSMFTVPTSTSDLFADQDPKNTLANLMISAFRFRGEHSRAIALFSVLVDKLSSKILSRRQQESESSRPLFEDIRIASIFLLSGGLAPFELRTIPRALIEFMTQWVNVVEHGDDSIISDQVALSGIDIDVHNRALASAAVLHANSKSNAFLQGLINDLRSHFQVHSLLLISIIIMKNLR